MGKNSPRRTEKRRKKGVILRCCFVVFTSISKLEFDEYFPCFMCNDREQKPIQNVIIFLI